MLPEINETKHPFCNLILAPIWGLLFIMALPAIGFFLFAQAIGLWVLETLKGVAIQPSPQTGAAYLTGSESGKPVDDLSDLEKEVADKRQSLGHETR